MITLGMPQSMLRSHVMMALAQCLAAHIPSPGRSVTLLLNLQVIARRVLWPLDAFGRARMKSMEMVWNGTGGALIGCMELKGRWWQVW